jgi:hypothetical protein
MEWFEGLGLGLIIVVGSCIFVVSFMLMVYNLALSGKKEDKDGGRSIIRKS